MTSERQAREVTSPWWGEHVHRYLRVLDDLGTRHRVLDLACGTGFGTGILASRTERVVVGGDVSFEAVRQCRRSRDHDNASFLMTDGGMLPFPDECFDVVVSFETIEHTTRYKGMLSEFGRILAGGGRAFISTPNFVVNSPSGVIVNPYHTQEFTHEELSDLLGDVFSSVTILGQKYSRYDGAAGLSSTLGRLVERLLYARGVRKLPLSVQDRIMKPLTGTPMYPTPEDFSLVSERSEVLSCKTFVAICER